MLKFPPFCAMLLLACALFPRDAVAQLSVDEILDRPVADLPRFDTSNCANCIFVQMPFGSSEFLNLDVFAYSTDYAQISRNRGKKYPCRSEDRQGA
jgi:hypothetical protein